MGLSQGLSPLPAAFPSPLLLPSQFSSCNSFWRRLRYYCHRQPVPAYAARTPPLREDGITRKIATVAAVPFFLTDLPRAQEAGEATGPGRQAVRRDACALEPLPGAAPFSPYSSRSAARPPEAGGESVAENPPPARRGRRCCPLRQMASPGSQSSRSFHLHIEPGESRAAERVRGGPRR